MLCVLIDDEESKESRREFPHGLVYLIGREVMPEYGVLVATCVISGYEFQALVHSSAFSPF
jgi:hypothetical protein